jgi:two-component system, cell cycle sensor histidine kinase and response regulator CckA
VHATVRRVAVSVELGERSVHALAGRLPYVTYTIRLAPPFPSVYISPQLQDLFGFSPDDCLGAVDFWTSRINPDDRLRFAASLGRLLQTREPMSVDYRVETGDGRQVWVRDVAIAACRGDELLAHGYLSDVTREKELEHQLRAERARTEAFFRDAPVGLGISDASGRYLVVNDALAQLNGAPAADHIGRTLAELLPSASGPARELLADVQRTGVPIYRRELEINLRGERRVVLASVFPIDADGEPQYGRIVMDITEQRRAEADQAASERGYQRLLEHLPLVTYVNELEPVYHTSYVSPQIEALYGYTVTEWLADVDLWNRVVHPDDAAIVRRGEAEARERHEPFELEYRFVRADGTVGWVLDRMETLYDEEGKPQSERGFLVDVTERRESEQMFRAVFDNAFEAVLLFDSAGFYVDANPAACALFGLLREELVGRPIGGLVEGGIGDPQSYDDFASAGEASGAFTLNRSDGELREIEYSAKAGVLPGRHLAVLRDVTERRSLERELWRAQKLESVGRLAGGVAHDFNNLLTAIRGYAQLLSSRTAAGSLERHHATEIDEAAVRAAALTAQLLALGRRQTLQASLVDLNELVEELAGMLARMVGEGVEIAYELEPDLPAAWVDPGQIEQVLLNLVANAADAMEGSGRLAIRTATAEVEAGHPDIPAGRYAVVSVEDFGSGIDTAALEHLFEPFFTTKEPGAGAGLGLAAAYGFVKQSGGTIVVETRPGEGSVFNVYLPATEKG